MSEGSHKFTVSSNQRQDNAGVGCISPQPPLLLLGPNVFIFLWVAITQVDNVQTQQPNTENGPCVITASPLSSRFHGYKLWLLQNGHTSTNYPAAAHAQSGVAVCVNKKILKCVLNARYTALTASKEHVDKENRTYFTSIMP